MAVLLRIVLLCLLVIHNFVSGQRLSGNTGLNCCKILLQAPFQRRQYAILRSYQILPSHGHCPQYLQFTTRGNRTFCIAISKGQEMKAFLDSQTEAPSKREFQKGWKEGTGIWEGMPKATLPPAVSPRSQDPPTTGISSPGPQSPITSNPSVSPSPRHSGTPRHEGRTMPTSTVTAQDGSHGQELTRVLPVISSSDQLQGVTTATQDKAKDRADIHLGKGMGTLPGRIIATVTSPPNGQGREEIRTGGVTHSDGPPLPGGSTVGAGAGDRHLRISEDRNRPSREGPEGQRSHFGLTLVCLFGVAAVVLLMWAVSVRGSSGKMYRVGDYYGLHPSKESATLVHYSRDFEASCGVV